MEDFCENVLQAAFNPFVLLGRMPWLALIPAVSFWYFRFHWRAGLPQAGSFGRRMPLTAALTWLGYMAWEWYMKVQYPPESFPIRIDLLFIAPVLYFLTIFGAMACWQLRNFAVASRGEI